VICIGGAANSFFEVYVDLSSYTHLASISPSNLKDETNLKSKSKHFCHIYKSDSTITCLLKYHVEPKDAMSWASLVSTLHFFFFFLFRGNLFFWNLIFAMEYAVMQGFLVIHGKYKCQ